MKRINSAMVILITIASLVGALGFSWLSNHQEVARVHAQSICTNLNMFRFDAKNGAKSYDAEAQVAVIEQDLYQLGYLCEGDNKLKQIKPVDFNDELIPNATTPTCEIDGKLVLPKVEHATWEVKNGENWNPALNDAGVGQYHVRLMADDEYQLPNRSGVYEWDITVQPKLTGDDCKNASEFTYECRTSGPNGGPKFMALMTGKPGHYSYGPAFEASTMEDARAKIEAQAFCDPVWMLQKYREYVDNKMSFEQAHSTALELIAEAKNGQNDRWDGMVKEIMESFDNSENSFDTISAGTYRSLGMVANTTDGVPRVVDFVVNDGSTSHVLRSIVTYKDGTKLELNLRMECNLQLRTKIEQPAPSPGRAPRAQEIPRNGEGTPIKEKPSKTPTVPPTVPPTTPPTVPPTTPPTVPTTVPPTTKPPTKPTPSPKSSNAEDYEHKTEAPKAKVTESARPKPDPVQTAKPGGGGVVDTPTKTPGSESGVTAPGANPAPTQSKAPKPQATGANTPAPSASSCVPAPGKASC